MIFRTLGDIRGKSLLDLACGDGFYTRRFKTECGADPVMGIDLSPKQIGRAEAIEQRERLGIEYRVGDVMSLDWEGRFDIISAAGLAEYGARFFENYLANPQSKLLRLTRGHHARNSAGVRDPASSRWRAASVDDPNGGSGI